MKKLIHLFPLASFPRMIAFAMLFLWSGCFAGKCHAQVLPVIDPYRFGVPTPCDNTYPFPLSGLVAYYKLDEAAGDTTRADASGNGVTLQNIEDSAGSVANTPFKIIAGYGPTILNNPFGHLATTNGTFNFANSSFSFAMWIRDTTVLTSMSALQFGQQNVANKLQWQFFLNNGTQGKHSLFVHRAGGASDSVSITNTAGTGTHYFVCGTYQNNGNSTAGNLALFYNGTNIVTTANTGVADSTLNTPDVNRFSIGSYITTSLFDLRVPIDEIGIWNRVLTLDEIAALYKCGDGRQP